MTFQQELFVAAVGGAVPVVLIVMGGQWLLNRYAIQKTRAEQKLELGRFIREQQYSALQEVYELFGRLMRLYRRVNLPSTDLLQPETKELLLNEACELESRVDAAILRIASEFDHSEPGFVEELLADLRQSAQLWRECIREEKRMPFLHSEQEDYRRFKDAFAATAAYLASEVFGQLEPSQVAAEDATKLLGGVFSNRWERHGIHLPADHSEGERAGDA